MARSVPFLPSMPVVPPDSRIRTSDPGDVRRWAERLGISEQRLLALVAQVGNDARDVARRFPTIRVTRWLPSE
jgi:hypothetical protein